MAKHELKITVAEDGSVKIGVRGAPGASCLDASKFLEDALGEGVERVETEEMYQTAETLVEQGEG